MDLLGHVNNVTYLDYLAEAREDVFAGHGAARAAVRQHRVEFVRPLVFRAAPVLVDTWVADVGSGEVTLAQEVYDGPTADQPDRVVYVRASTVLSHRLTESERTRTERAPGPAQEWRPVPDDAGSDRAQVGREVYPLVVRRSDLGEHGLARTGVYFEYVQEARIHYLMNLRAAGEQWTDQVVARSDVDYLGPIGHRSEPYALHSWIGHVGNRSYTMHSEIRDGEQVLARAAVVIVAFDVEAQRPAAMPAHQRARLERELSDSTG